VAKDHPQRVFEISERWLDEASRLRSAERTESRRWIVRHALRHPWKKRDAEAKRLRLAAGYVERKPNR